MKDISYLEASPAEEASKTTRIEEAVSDLPSLSFEDIVQVEMSEESEAGCLSYSEV